MSVLIAVIDICFGMKIAAKFVGTAVFWVMIAYIGFHVLIEIILLINKYALVSVGYSCLS